MVTIFSLQPAKQYVYDILLARAGGAIHLDNLPWEAIFSYELDLIVSASNLSDIPYPDVTSEMLGFFVVDDDAVRSMADELGGIVSEVVAKCVGALNPNLKYSYRALNSYGDVLIIESEWGNGPVNNNRY